MPDSPAQTAVSGVGKPVRTQRPRHPPQFKPQFEDSNEAYHTLPESKLKLLSNLTGTATILIAVGPALLGSALGMLSNAYILGAPPPDPKVLWFVVSLLLLLGVGALVWFAIEKFHHHNEDPACVKKWIVPKWPGVFAGLWCMLLYVTLGRTSIRPTRPPASLDRG